MATAPSNIIHMLPVAVTAPEEEVPFTSAEQEAALAKAKTEAKIRRTAAADARKAGLELDLAKSYTITVAGDRSIGEAAMMRLKELEGKAHAALDAPCKEAYDFWKVQTGMRAAIIDPLDAARKLYNTSIGQWDQSEKRRLEAARDAALAAERAAVLERNEATVQAAEERGASDTEIAALCAAPLVVAPIVERVPEKKSTGVTTRDVTKGRFVSLLALVKHIAKDGNEHLITLVEGNEPGLNKLLSAMPTIVLPGVEKYTDYQSQRRGGK